MGRRLPITRLIVLIAMLAVLGNATLVSAQTAIQSERGSTSTIVGAIEASIAKTGYTATDDLWVWRARGKQHIIESRTVRTELSYTDTFGQIGLTGEPGTIPIEMRHRMSLEIRPVQRTRSQREGIGDSKTAQEVSVSGRATAVLNWFVPDVGDEVLISSLSWDARIDGRGLCIGDDCDLVYELSGTLRTPNGQRTCGEMNLVLSSDVDLNAQALGFKSVSGMDPWSELVNSGEIGLRVAPDGSTCLKKGIDSLATLTGDVNFFYGDIENDGPYTIDRPHRVMPGDNIRLEYLDIPVNFLQRPENAGDELWDPDQAPAQMMQDMRVELALRGEDRIILVGEVRGQFLSGLEAAGEIRGEGTLDDRGRYEITMIRDFDIFGDRGTTRCGSMSLQVTVYFTPGDGRTPPIWTFGTDGAGSITLLESERCVLDGSKSNGDI